MMIVMPVWVLEETREGYRVLLGSEPKKDADKEWMPKNVVQSCTYTPGVPNFPKFALMTLREVPEDIKKKNPGLYGA